MVDKALIDQTDPIEPLKVTFEEMIYYIQTRLVINTTYESALSNTVALASTLLCVQYMAGNLGKSKTPLCTLRKGAHHVKNATRQDMEVK